MHIKRLAASISATFDDFVTRVENHEAVADSVIAEVSRGAASLKVQLNRVQAQLAHLKRERVKNEKVRERWTQRARRLAASDQDRALGCVAQLERCEATVAELDRQIEDHDGLRRRMQDDLTRVEAKLAELRLRRSALGSRHARVKAMRGAAACDAKLDVDGLFDRWETSVLGKEYALDFAADPMFEADQLEQHLVAEERSAERLERLRALTEQTPSK